eukprot:1395119-Amorphochlora_amoeboformis.AAC.1
MKPQRTTGGHRGDGGTGCRWLRAWVRNGGLFASRIRGKRCIFPKFEIEGHETKEWLKENVFSSYLAGRGTFYWILGGSKVYERRERRGPGGGVDEKVGLAAIMWLWAPANINIPMHPEFE